MLPWRLDTAQFQNYIFSLLSTAYTVLQVFVLGETAKLHVRVVNQSARNVRSIKVRLVLAISHLGSAFSVPFFVRTDMVRYPHKVEGNGGVFEGDLEYKIPLNVYPSSAGQYSTCTCATVLATLARC